MNLFLEDLILFQYIFVFMQLTLNRLDLSPCGVLVVFKHQKVENKFKNRWLPPVPLVYPRSACFFFNVRSMVKMKQAAPLAKLLAD